MTLRIGPVLDRYESHLIAYAARITGDTERARDIVQDVFVRFCQTDHSSLDGHIGRWLFTVCRNRALDVRRKEGRMKLLTADDVATNQQPIAPPRPSSSDSNSAANMLEALATLPERQQEVLRLKFEGGLTYEEIAGVLSSTAGNVGVLIHTAIKTLRKQLTPNQTSIEAAPKFRRLSS
ncbi:MAG: sigma-70 family RNA polymerase sigma factor [Phycisphaerales bacterium]